MSLDLYIECHDHTPHLSSADVAQHLSDLPRIRDDIANRGAIIAALELDITPDEHFRSVTAWFLQQHPHCQLAIRDEVGRLYPLEADDDDFAPVPVASVPLLGGEGT